MMHRAMIVGKCGLLALSSVVWNAEENSVNSRTDRVPPDRPRHYDNDLIDAHGGQVRPYRRRVVRDCRAPASA